MKASSTSPGGTLDTRTDRASPRAPNAAGHIVELIESGGDAAATAFSWEIFLLAGAPGADRLACGATVASIGARFAADVHLLRRLRPMSTKLSAFANPDNLGFRRRRQSLDRHGRQSAGDTNDGCFVCPTDGAERGQVRQFMSGPVGAEDLRLRVHGRTGARCSSRCSIRAPAARRTAPHSHWPDGGRAAPRPSLVAIDPDGTPTASSAS